MPWVLWNYRKQDHPRRELVVVDGSEDASALAWPGDVTFVRCPPGTTVARKRNLAVEAARGEIVTWFDDDDWQHPRRLSSLAGALAGGARLAGSSKGWFVDLHRGLARMHSAHGRVIFNGLGVRRDALHGVRFDERRLRAADTSWLSAILRETRCVPVVMPQVLSFWLCHHDSLSNPATRYIFSQPLSAVRGAVGAAAWDGTDEQLARLRDGLTGG